MKKKMKAHCSIPAARRPASPNLEENEEQQMNLNTFYLGAGMIAQWVKPPLVKMASQVLALESWLLYLPSSSL